MPWFHSNALYHATFPTIATGGTIAMRRRFSASAFIDDVRRFGATRFNYVGKVLEYILATPPRDIDADNQLRIVTGSEASERDIAAFGARFDVYVMDGFGSTEGGVGILRTPDSPPGALGLPPNELTVVIDPATEQECPPARFDADGRLLNAEEAIGELVNKGGLAAFEGYYRNDDANAERVARRLVLVGRPRLPRRAGLLLLRRPRLRLAARRRRELLRGPVERIVLRHPDVMLAAVYAVPDPNTGDQLMLAVQLAEGATFDPDVFRRFLAAQGDLGTKWVPRFVRISPALPASHTNKIKKAQLRQEAWLVDDPIWFRPDRADDFRPFEPADADALEQAFAAAGRTAVAPRRA